MLQLCKVLESLNLNIVTTNFSSFSTRLSTTLFLQADEEERSTLETKIQTAIAAYNDPSCFINFYIEFPVAESVDEADKEDRTVVVSKERTKVVPGKFQWFWKFGRNSTGEETRSNGVGISKNVLVCSSQTHSPPHHMLHLRAGKESQTKMC
ncbi:hypothetical protein F2Q69_00057680 [Brassica cretica]|uniref:Plant bHLH transcription factor ACT-like domain-containing protein n=1 Tax=Brassica cretica TaxID=69181 RepID=A0A8S9N2V1_BRACR|nr:hypothetical protein F2Q69_00057680 [Brassica cretica]